MGRTVTERRRDYKRGLAAAGPETDAARQAPEEDQQKDRDAGEQECVHERVPLLYLYIDR
jgi:hypothetical protein